MTLSHSEAINVVTLGHVRNVQHADNRKSVMSRNFRPECISATGLRLVYFPDIRPLQSVSAQRKNTRHTSVQHLWWIFRWLGSFSADFPHWYTKLAGIALMGYQSYCLTGLTGWPLTLTFPAFCPVHTGSCDYIMILWIGKTIVSCHKYIVA